MRRQQLQRHVPVEREIMGPIDHTHPATSEQRLQPIAGQLRPDTRVAAHRAHRGGVRFTQAGDVLLGGGSPGLK